MNIGKKKMKNKIRALISALAAVLSAAVLYSGLYGCGEAEYKSQLYAMNTVIDLSFYGDDGQKTVSRELNRLESLFSVTRGGSDISKINSANGKTTAISEDTAKVLSAAKRIYDETDELFDPSIYPLLKLWGFTTEKYTVPSKADIESALTKVDFSRLKLDGNKATAPKGMELDLGGIGKGYAGDVCRSALKNEGITSAILSLGGNVCTVGLKPDGSKWLVALKNPDGGDYLCEIKIGECSVVTSGGYERSFESGGKTYHHILDPRTGFPAEGGLKSATVICADGAVADALSTAIFIGGERLAERILEEREDINLILYTSGGELLASRGIEGDIVLNGAVAEDKFRIIG